MDCLKMTRNELQTCFFKWLYASLFNGIQQQNWVSGSLLIDLIGYLVEEFKLFSWSKIQSLVTQ